VILSVLVTMKAQVCMGHRMQTSYRDIPAFKSSDGSAAQVL